MYSLNDGKSAVGDFRQQHPLTKERHYVHDNFGRDFS